MIQNNKYSESIYFTRRENIFVKRLKEKAFQKKTLTLKVPPPTQASFLSLPSLTCSSASPDQHLWSQDEEMIVAMDDWRSCQPHPDPRWMSLCCSQKQSQRWLVLDEIFLFVSWWRYFFKQAHTEPKYFIILRVHCLFRFSSDSN